MGRKKDSVDVVNEKLERASSCAESLKYAISILREKLAKYEKQKYSLNKRLDKAAAEPVQPESDDGEKKKKQKKQKNITKWKD